MATGSKIKEFIEFVILIFTPTVKKLTSELDMLFGINRLD